VRVSVIIANRNDAVMLNVTVRSAIEALKAIRGQSEIVICDNSDQQIFDILNMVIPGQYLQEQKVRIIRQDYPCFSSARMTAAREAKGKYIFCVDSHVLFGHNVIGRAVAAMDDASDKIGFIHPPANWSHQGENYGRHDIDMDLTPWGMWNRRYTKPTKISWGFQPWICRRDWYLNILNGYGAIAYNHLAWGGAEMHQEVKAILLGYENWAIPSSPVIHIGPFNKRIVELTPYKYRVYCKSGEYPAGLGILVAFYVWGGDDMKKEAYKIADRLKNRHGLCIDEWWDTARTLGESERQWLSQKQVMTYWEMMENKPWLS
jgi:glycosyltransferase involved in cell wall biosynthesis